MRDIVERLTFTADQFDAGFGGKSATTKLMREAADEIERLGKELEARSEELSALYSERHLFAKQRTDDITEIERLRKQLYDEQLRTDLNRHPINRSGT